MSDCMFLGCPLLTSDLVLSCLLYVSLAIYVAGVVKATTGHLAEAIQLFARTLELDPSHQSAKKFLDHAKKQLGQKT